MKAQPQEEPLLNTLARHVGGAAGVVAKAVHGLAPATTTATRVVRAKASSRLAAISGKRSVSKNKSQSRNRRAKSSPRRSAGARRAKSNLSTQTGN